MSQDRVSRLLSRHARRNLAQPDLETQEAAPDTPKPTTQQQHIAQLQHTLGNRASRTALQRLSDNGEAAHTHQCRCPACTGRLTAQSRQPLTISTNAQATLQRCKYCGDDSCEDGEICNYGADMGGLFTPGLTTRDTGLHGQTKKSSKRKVYESEHVIPHQAWKLSGSKTRYDKLPAMSIPYDMHRGGVSGAGGGVTSTGSSHTAKGWAIRLSDKMKGGDMAGALLDVANDEYNSASMSGFLSESMVSQITQIVNVFAIEGYITQEEAGKINNVILDRWYKDNKIF
jgi:uncharacterized protein with PIN domain